MFQQYVTIFCTNLGKSSSSTREILRAGYGQAAGMKSIVFEWQTRFKEGREGLGNDGWSGRPKTHRMCENVEMVRHLIRFDRRLSR